jgi:hypothetical protein
VNSGQIRALLMNALALHGKGGRIHTLLKNGGYLFSFTAPSPGRLVISWYRTKHGKQILVATVTFVFQKSGTARIEIVLTGKGRNLLKGGSKMKLTANAGFTPAGQGTSSASRGITLKP